MAAHRHGGTILTALLAAGAIGLATKVISDKKKQQQQQPAGPIVTAIICPECGATASGNFCEFCGTNLR
ncbi:MAG: hypothetical protein IKM30_05350 [Oscillospiraceae bacterium]|nr:hypothetical protein [Oscillospiraceae bacterium]